MRLFLIGGFLGSGKTTAITTASKMLMSQGRKVAVVTNDQGEQLVDNSFVESFEIPTRAVSNGCFCCNYDQLDVHIQALNEENKPEFIFAEFIFVYFVLFVCMYCSFFIFLTFFIFMPEPKKV